MSNTKDFITLADHGPIRVREKGFAVANVASLGRCAVENRGAMVRVDGASGVADQYAVCHKNGSNTYEWLESSTQTPAIATYLGPNAAVTWTNMPAAETAFNSVTAYNYHLDATGYRQARLVVATSAAAAAGAKILLRATTDTVSFTTIIDLTIGGIGHNISPWTDLPSLAKLSSVFWMIRGSGGNATADPIFTHIYIQIR